MQNLGRPVGRASAQSSFSGFSPQAAEEQGQITGSNDEDVARRQRRLKAEGKKAWKVWRARKDQIVDLIRAPGFPHSEDTDGPKRKKLKPMGSNSFNMFSQDDYYVLRPTAAELWDLPAFIAKVENIIGRKKGFVKFILPNEMKSDYCPPHPTVTASYTGKLLSNESSSSIRPYQTKLELHKPFEPKMEIYSVAMLGAVNVLISEWQEAMQKYQEKIMKRGKHLLCTPSNEKEMIADSKRDSDDDMYYTTDIQESPSFRQALQLGGPYLRGINGNRLQEPRFKELEMDRPQIHLAGAKGSPFGLEMTDHAAYSLNYLHRGAPKRWVIIEPEAHPQLEELLHPEVESVAERLVKKSRTKFVSPTHPPRCDGFLGHQPLYVPKDTLALHGIAHTELVQYQGEMLVTFPFASYQGICEGPSVAEVTAFGNDRWETIHKSGLYQSCHANCSGSKVPEISAKVDQTFPGHIGGRIDGYVPEPGLSETGSEIDSDTGSETEDGNGEGASIKDGITSRNPATEASTTTKNAVAGFKGDEMSEDEPLMWIK